jgi:hypothetical protein
MLVGNVGALADCFRMSVPTLATCPNDKSLAFATQLRRKIVEILTDQIGARIRLGV